jgi:hypothetical protein
MIVIDECDDFVCDGRDIERYPTAIVRLEHMSLTNSRTVLDEPWAALVETLGSALGDPLDADHTLSYHSLP